MTQQIINRRIARLDPPVIGLDDPGFMRGAGGFFETLRVDGRRVRLFEPHLKRIEQSLAVWRIQMPCEREGLIETIRLELESFPPDARLRLRIVIGAAPEAAMEASGDASGLWPSRAFVWASPLPEAYSVDVRLRPAQRALVFEDYRIDSRHPLAGHKSTQFYLYWEADRRAVARGYDQAILLNERDELVEAGTSNLFWIAGGKVFTPAAECGALPGVVARRLIEGFRGQGIEVIRTRAGAGELLNAEAVFLTSSLALVHAVESVNGRQLKPVWDTKIGAGIPSLLAEIDEGGLSV